MRKVKYGILMGAALAVCLMGCGESRETVTEAEDLQDKKYVLDLETSSEIVDNPVLIESDEDLAEFIEEPFAFRDVFGVTYESVINPGIPKVKYSKENYSHDGIKMYYEDDTYTSRLGIDVSRHQGDIKWDEVKEAGFEFVFMRIGFRGYGEEGNVKLDSKFDDFIVGAQKAGLDVGVYFFSQAINEEEALEEADFVISHLQNYELQLPVVYDPESILDQPARTDDVTAEQFTANSVAFCKRIAEAGYQPGIYSNMLWEAFELDLTQLEGIPVWYADYEEVPQTPYDFEYLQYSNEYDSIPGVSGVCDVDIQIVKKVY